MVAVETNRTRLRRSLHVRSWGKTSLRVDRVCRRVLPCSVKRPHCPPAPSLLHAGVFSHRSHQCLQVLATRFVRSSSLSSRCGQPTSFADPPHRMSSTYLCSPCMLLMLSMYTHVKVFRCLRRACPYFHFLLGARDQPTSLVYFSSTCWIFHQPPPLALYPVAPRFLVSLALSRHCL